VPSEAGSTGGTSTGRPPSGWSFDRRTRTVDDVAAVEWAAFVDGVPALLDTHGDLATRAFRGSELGPFTIAVDDQAVTWRLDHTNSLEVVDGDTGEGPRADLPAEWFSDIVTNQRSAVAVMIAGEPVMTRGRIDQLIGWEPTLRALVDGRPAYEPGLVDFIGRDGDRLDLSRSFRLDDDPADLAHFLGQVGCLVVRGVFSLDEMAQLDAEMEEWFARMTPDDQRSWYARVGDRSECVRVTNLEADDLTFPFSARLAPLAAISGANHAYAGTDLLRKPVAVTEGISDLPWHKDCELGMHSYRCASLTCGVSVTASGDDNGQLGVVAGSHRVNVGMFDVGRVDLPQLFLSTDPGDVTVHLSCALHCATPPKHSERRVTYSTFRLPGDTDELDRKIKAVRDQAGRDTYAPTQG